MRDVKEWARNIWDGRLVAACEGSIINRIAAALTQARREAFLGAERICEEDNIRLANAIALRRREVCGE